MSRQRKTAAVLRLLRVEDLELVSRSPGVAAATLTNGRDAEELENDRLNEKIANLEANHPLAHRRLKP